MQIINNQAIKERYLNHEIKPQTANYKALAVFLLHELHNICTTHVLGWHQNCRNVGEHL